jgi:acyl-coenzyme A synthetase/AMP-(fatty) acid ligase
MPLPAGYREFERRFGVRTSTGWGMTEIGFPMAVADPDVPGTCGELIIRPHLPWLMLRSYLGRWEATARAWRNGWFHTGDGLRLDAAGNYFFVDRVADYLRTRGNNVSSLEVEAEVRTHPAVADCACIGVPAELEGDDDIKLVVIRAEGSAGCRARRRARSARASSVRPVRPATKYGTERVPSRHRAMTSVAAGWAAGYARLSIDRPETRCWDIRELQSLSAEANAELMADREEWL